MRNKLISLKKALFGGMAFVMAATLVSPASAALAAEVETQTAAEEAAADTGKSTADAADTAAGAQTAAEAAELREMNLKVTNRTTGRPGEPPKRESASTTKPLSRQLRKSNGRSRFSGSAATVR